MTDVLADRIAPFVDHADGGDWSDVRRRARKKSSPYLVVAGSRVLPPVRGQAARFRRRSVLAVAVVAAVIVSAAAFAANGGWWFSKSGSEAFGTTRVQFHGKLLALNALFSRDGRSFCLLLQENQADIASYVASGCGGSVLAVKGLPQRLLPEPPAPSGPPFGATYFEQGGGQIWFGDARPEVAAITITDSRGRTFSTQTVAPEEHQVGVQVLGGRASLVLGGNDRRVRWRRKACCSALDLGSRRGNAPSLSVSGFRRGRDLRDSGHGAIALARHCGAFSAGPRGVRLAVRCGADRVVGVFRWCCGVAACRPRGRYPVSVCGESGAAGGRALDVCADAEVIRGLASSGIFYRHRKGRSRRCLCWARTGRLAVTS